jgi:hypothetical protein
MSELTKAMRKALAWLDHAGPTSQFPIAEVNFSMIKRAEKLGLVRRVASERQIGMVIYTISDAGCLALSENSDDKG